VVWFAAVNGLNNFRVGCLTSLPSEGTAIDTDSYRVCRDLQTGVTTGLVVTVDCPSADACRYVIIQSLDTAAEKLCIAEACVLETSQYIKKGKVFPYSLPSVGPGADPGVQAVSPQVT